MKKTVISGVVFMLIVTNPAMFSIEVFAYELLKSKLKITDNIEVAKKLNEGEKYIDTEIEAEEIDAVVTNLDSNTRKINSLLREKESIVEKVQTRMDLLAQSRSRLSEEQIMQFQDFITYYQKESEIVKAALENIHSNNLTAVKSEMLHTDSDFKYIYDELSMITNYQSEAMQSINSIIDSGEKTLAIL